MRVVMMVACCSLVLLLTACGPERSSSTSSDSLAQTHEIANNYYASRDLAEARTKLQELDVANENQWLIFATEEAIKQNENRAEIDALVTLVLDLGLQSHAIVTYAQQNNVVAGTLTGGAAPDVAASVDTIIIPLPTNTDVASSAESAVGPENNSAATTIPTTQAEEVVVADVDNASDQEAALATATPEPTTAPEPTPTPALQPVVRAASGINVRTGPGTDYPIAGAMNGGDSAQILNKNATGDWWEVQLASGGSGWVYGSLVETAGDLSTIAVAIDIPAPPPTAIPTPVATEPPVEAVPTEEPAPAPAPGGPDFRVVEKRLWDVVENGGRLDGPSVTCGEKRQLVARVLDANGNLLNGVAVQAIYGAQEIFVTGTQGKGDGTVEFVLGGGQALKVIRDADGREVSSEEVYGMSTKPWEIPYETLIGGNFCTDEASCKSFVDATGCYGHYSWTVTFQKAY